MGWAIRADHIPSITSYKKAEELFNYLYPLRNMPENVRAISKRAEKHKLLVKHDESYAARLYQTDLVTYHKDGAVTITPYASQSSKLFINAVCPSGLAIETVEGVFFIKAEAGYYRARDDSITFKQDGLGEWKPINPAEIRQEYVLKSDLKKMAKVREKLETYFDWARGFSRLNRGMEHTLTLTRPGITKSEAMEKLLLEPDNPEHFTDVYYYLRAMEPQTRAVAYEVSDCYTQSPIHPTEVFLNKSRLAW